MKQSLNFSWEYINDYKEEYLNSFPRNTQLVDIPHSLVELPYNYFDEGDYQKIVTYRKVFDVDESIKDKTVILKFDGYMLKAKVFLNGENLGEFVSGYIPVSINITEQVKQKGNELIVVLDSHEDPNYPPFGYAVDYLTFSGIYREVSLIIHEKSYLDNIYVHGDNKGNINITYDVVGEKIADPEYVLLDKDDKELARFSSNEYKLENPILWDLDNPYLYKLRIKYNKEEYIERFGFKSSIFKNDGFYLNDKKVKLIGLNRHQGYPYMGYAASKSLQEEDADLLKNVIGVNVVRTSHYPQSEHFLNRCDEIGLLVINEIPGWQFVGTSDVWKNQYYKNVETMVLSQRGHTSLIAHGVRIDESRDDHELYQKGNEIAHNLDKYHQTLGVRNFKGSELLEDIYSYNDFSGDRLEHGLLNPKDVIKRKPYIVTEYMGHMDPVKPTSDIVIQKEVALRHARVINDNLRYSSMAGAIGWCFVDYHTHADFGSGDHICPHGVFDMYRNPKLSSSIYASQQDNFPVLEVLNNMKPGDFKEAIYEDIHVATNCDYIKLFKNNNLVGTFYPNNKEFPYLKHPPIIIDDIVGFTLNDKRFSKKDNIKMAKLLSESGIDGFNHMKKSSYFKLAVLTLKYHAKYQEIVDLWNEHISAWGGLAKTYKFVGYKDDKEVIVKELGPSKKNVLDVKANKTILKNEETYDTLRVVVRHLDEHGMLCTYSNRVISIETSGPIKIYGENHQALLGGQLSIFVRSLNQKGKGKIKIKMDDLESEISVDVQ